jgi:polar amino acid transport system substrate-binding protein
MLRDPNTSALSGLSKDMMEEIAKRASLKVEWTAEITWANWVPELQADRFDVACTPMWPDMPMTKAVSFTKPILYSGLHPVVRKDDERFVKDPTLARLNQPDVTILTQEGNATAGMVARAFPNAKLFVLPATASGGEYYQALLAKKADATLTDLNGLYFYEQANGNNFMLIEPNNPVKLQPFQLATRRGEADLVNFINLGIEDLYDSGEMDRLIRKWEPEPGRSFLRVAKPVELAR